MPTALMPPASEWWNQHHSAVEKALRKSNPDWDEETLSDMTARSLCKTWYADSKQVEPEQKAILPLFTKSKSRMVAVHQQTDKGDPYVVVEVLDGKGVLEGLEVKSPAEVLKSPANYDDRAIQILIHKLSEYEDDYRSDAHKLGAFTVIDRLADILQKRISDRVEAFDKQCKEWEGKGLAIEMDESPYAKNQDFKMRMYFGKSAMILVTQTEKS